MRELKIEGVDVDAAIAMMGGMTDIYLETLQIYCADCEERIDKIRDCLEQGNIKDYTIYVHALKSASESVGARGLYELAKRLEAAGISGDVDFLRANTGDFLHQLNAVLQSIYRAIS